MKKGFSLIEVILYIGLLSVLISTAFVSAYQLVDSSTNTSNENLIISEKIFIMKKFEWAFNDLSSNLYPLISGSVSCAESIIIYKANASENVEIQLNTQTSSIEIKSGLVSDFLPINTDRIKVTCLEFETLRSIDGTPEKVVVKIRIDDEDVEIVKFIKHE